MDYELKSMSTAAITKSLGKAHRYRLLNEPMHAESIPKHLSLIHI